MKYFFQSFESQKTRINFFRTNNKKAASEKSFEKRTILKFIKLLIFM